MKKTGGCEHATDWLDLQTLGSQLIIMPKNLPGHWSHKLRYIFPPWTHTAFYRGGGRWDGVLGKLALAMSGENRYVV